MLAVEAKRRDEWERLAWGLMWVVNRMPNFSKRRRPPVRMHHLNPMRQADHSRRSGLSDDGIELALDAMAARSERR